MFGENLKILRKQRGLSQEELAARLHVVRQTISKWELNQSSPDLDLIVKLSELFEVSTDYLIKGIELNSDKPIQKKERNTENKWAKNLVVGCVFLILGAIGSGIVLMAASNNLVDAWWTPPGRLMTTIQSMSLMPFLVISVLFVVCGIVILIIEYFRK